MRNRARLDRVCEFSKSILFGCVLLLLTSRISALTVNESTENHESKKPLEGISKAEDLIDDSDAPDVDRYATRSSNLSSGYILTEARLREIRSEFMYWFFDKGGSKGSGDYQKDIQTSMPQMHKDFDFQLPFFGSRFNYARVSMNGYLEFSDPPEHYTYPLVFPVKDWPKENDPSFIGIFFSKCRKGELRSDDIDQRSPGVYFRLEEDLQRRTDQFGVEFRERLKWDIHEAIVGSDSFQPKHAIVATWKNVSFAGGIDNSLYKTNTFQMILATDEVSTYAMFNYLDIQWTSHTEAGGDTVAGEGGVPAYIGFNAGNGTGAYEYKPYSQTPRIRDLTRTGGANGFPGRHVFKIDRDITLGTCNNPVAAKLAMKLSPAGGNKLGGTIVNITGPCFNRTDKIRCKFDNVWVYGAVIDRSRAICIQPYVEAYGSIDFAISIGGDKPYTLEGKYSIDYPTTGKPGTTPSDTWPPTTWIPDTTPPNTWRPDTTSPDSWFTTTRRPDTPPPTTWRPDTTPPNTWRPGTPPPTTWRPDTTPPNTWRPGTTPPNTWRPDTTSPDSWFTTTRRPGTPPPTTWRPDTTPSTTWHPTTWRPNTTPPNTVLPTTWRPETTPPNTWRPDTTPDTLPPTTWRPDTTTPDTWPPTTWRPDTTPDTLPPTTWRPDSTTPDTWPPTTGRPTPPSVGPIREHEHGEIKITWNRYKYT